MTASALNSASIAPAGPTGATAPASAGAGGAVAGFDALLAALFPQEAPPGAPEAAAPGAAQAAPMLPPSVDIEDSPAEAQPETPVVADPADPADPDAAAAAAIAASLMVPQPAAAAQPAITAATDASAHVPHAWGRDKVNGAPAQPAILHANPNADLAGKAELAAEAAGDADADAGALTGHPAKADPSPAAAPPPAARPHPQAAPAPAASAPVAPPVADVAVDVAPAPPPPAEPAPLETAPAALQAQAMATQAPRAEAPPPASGARSTKTERGKAEATASSDLKPREATDKPVHAKAVEGAAKTAAAASVEAVETETSEAEPAADAPDASLPAETRAAAQSAAPAAHTAHAVRGSPETVANLAAQIIKKLEGQSTRFDLELNPQGLGRVDVRVEIGAHGQMTASMLFDNPQAAQELKSRAAELQRALEQAGFDLSGGLSFDVTGDRGQQGQAWQDQNDTGRAFRGQAFKAALETAGEVADAASQGALRLRRGVNAGLDLRMLTMVDAVSASAAASATGRTRLAENFDTFLTLLTTQLKNQDPLSPMDSTQFTQQLVQMTGVEQQLLTNDLLEKLVANTGSGVATAVSLIGKEVRADADVAALSGGKAEWVYKLDRTASDVKIEVLDSKGRVVQTVAPTENGVGEHTFKWDGKTAGGSTAADGIYSLRVKAKDSAGSAVPTGVVSQGIVSGVQQVDGQTLVTINGAQIPWEKITLIREPPKPPVETETASTDNDNNPDDEETSSQAAA